MNGNVQQWSQRVATAARSASRGRRRRRRTTVPIMLACIAGIVAGRDILFPSGLPKGALAGSIISSVLPRVAESPAATPPTLQSTPALSPLEQWLAQPIEPVTRNLFCPSGKSPAGPIHVGNNGYITRNAAPGVAPTPNSVGFRGGLQKSVDADADGQGRRDSSSRVLTEGAAGSEISSDPVAADDRSEQARQIRLQSTLASSAKPSALVNGQLVREGDVVAVGAGSTRSEYRVLRIEARRILLEREGIELEVTMD